MLSFHAIIPAAGSGSRFGAGEPKHLLRVAGRTLVDHSIAALLADERVTTVHVAIAVDADPSEPGATLPGSLAKRISVHACGGETRAKTVLAAAKIAQERGATWLAVHDAARPCLHKDDLRKVLEVADKKQEPALLAAKLPDTLKRGEHGKVAATVSRSDKFLAQTPQVCEARALIEALTMHEDVTDESEAFERMGRRPLLVQASHPNPKLTYPPDLKVIAALLTGLSDDDSGIKSGL